MRDGKGIRNSKFEMRKLEIGRKCSRQGRQAPTGVRGADAGLRKKSMNMNQIYKIVIIFCLSFSRCLAGDLLLDETGTYSGMLSGGTRTTKTGAYNGCISADRRWMCDKFGAYAGFITRDGTVFDSKGRFSGLTSRLKDAE